VRPKALENNRDAARKERATTGRVKRERVQGACPPERGGKGFVRVEPRETGGTVVPGNY